MGFIQIVHFIIAVLTILTGLVSLFWPMKVLSFTGLQVSSGRGVSEIRTVLGAVFIGLGAATIYINETAAFQTLGITYLFMAVVRAISVFADDAKESSNIISVMIEAVFGIFLII